MARVITGRRLNEDIYTVQIVTPEGRLVSLVKGELRDWSVSQTSPMPSYKDTLSADDARRPAGLSRFADGWCTVTRAITALACS